MGSTASAPVRPAALTERHPHTLPPPPPTSRSVELAPVRVEVPLSQGPAKQPSFSHHVAIALEPSSHRSCRRAKVPPSNRRSHVAQPPPSGRAAVTLSSSRRVQPQSREFHMTICGWRVWMGATHYSSRGYGSPQLLL
jgi:hypothetical protein